MGLYNPTIIERLTFSGLGYSAPKIRILLMIVIWLAVHITRIVLLVVIVQTLLAILVILALSDTLLLIFVALIESCYILLHLLYLSCAS